MCDVGSLHYIVSTFNNKQQTEMFKQKFAVITAAGSVLCVYGVENFICSLHFISIFFFWLGFLQNNILKVRCMFNPIHINNNVFH